MISGAGRKLTVAEEDDIFPTGLRVGEARGRMMGIGAAQPLSSENIALEAALGRVLASDIVAPHDVPGFANSAMDGFALRGADLPATGEKTFRLLGAILAGGGAAPDVVPDGCVRITTGAPL